MLNPEMRHGFRYARGVENYIAALSKSPVEFLFGGPYWSMLVGNDAAIRGLTSLR
jgi:hypothetical protein